ncbi:hypothetical protein FOJ82_00530 [Tessaracoccus rhinocerotis]|uniref:Uncharacterized protein n=1 Tax=Tessaracoccus rhinocerotis TaxID=1689449 RepID=A0A553K400_9ACTN|nr:hypothetical protein [Tessaracoccus rhinocerotis]TRY19437.1 hypothetical protein FOJ82_00530 [Tessaracoccus rhinocerotis]
MKKSMVVLGVVMAALLAGFVLPAEPVGAANHSVRFVEQLPIPESSALASAASELEPGSEAAKDFEAAMVPLRDILDEYSSNFAGFVADWSNKGKYIVNIVDRTGPGANELAELISEYGPHLFELREVPMSDDEILRKMDSLAVGDHSKQLLAALTEMYADEATGTVMMTLDENMVTIKDDAKIFIEDRDEQRSARVSEVNLRGVANSVGMDFVITLKPREQVTPASTRTNSSAPYRGGAWIRTTRTLPDGTAGLCSLGMPNLRLNGVNYVSSTAHCAYGVFNQPWATSFLGENGSPLGTVFANSNTAGYGPQIYGEWLLIRASTSLTAFTGPALGSTATSDLTGADFAAVGENASVCTSGRTTGGRCRLRILQRHVYKTMPFKTTPSNSDPTVNVTVARLTQAKYDPGWNGVYTCGGPYFGDSGGLAFYDDSVRPGKKWGYGMFQSFTTPSSNTNCTYYIQELNGIRAKYPAITVGA